MEIERETEIPNYINFTELGVFFRWENKMKNGSQGSTQLDITILLLLAVICDYSVRTVLGGGIISCILWLRKGRRCASFSSLT